MITMLRYMLTIIMLNFKEKEACGIPLLGVFAVGLGKELTKTISTVFKVDMQFNVVASRKNKARAKTSS